MKHSFIYILCGILLLAACGNNSFVAEKWENGKPKIILRVEKGSREKPEKCYYKAYYPNGNLFKEGMIMDTVEDGEWKTYYATGELRSKGYYNMGVKDGDFSIFYRNGNTEQTGTYEGDSIAAASLYYPNGKMMKVDSTKLILQSGLPAFTDIQYANMHMECTMLFFDNYERGTKVCSCYLDAIQHQLTYSQYELLTERQVTILMKYIMPDYKDCLDK